MQKLVDVSAYPVFDVLNVLLEDKTTGKNVVWATDAYASRGSGFGPEDQITKEAFIGDDPVLIQPRIEKDALEQQARTKKKAEVYTPSWLCNKMNNYCDEEWFGRPKVFNEENGGGAWTARKESVWFNQKKGRKTKEWQKYVDSRRLEITCGEAPFLVSRYDAATGEILPIKQRIGILDRKLRVVDENTTTETDWLKWAQRAVESCYGYEYQGDSLLIARNNVLMTFYDYYTERWKKLPEKRLFKKIANIVAWNIWQMDGLTDAPPFGKTAPKKNTEPLFEGLDKYELEETTETNIEKPLMIKNWRSKNAVPFVDLKEVLIMKNKNKLFDFVIGNPPYQNSTESYNRQEPIYPFFYDSAEMIADRYMLITPARFLFNAGLTPKDWNQKMLSDKHLCVEYFNQNATEVFPNTDIKGGIVIMYRDVNQNFGAIEHFVPDENLRNVLSKVIKVNPISISIIIYGGRSSLKFNNNFLDKYPSSKTDRLRNIQAKHIGVEKLAPNEEYELKSSTFDVLPYSFLTDEPENINDYYKILGLSNGKRVYRWIKREYMTPRYPSNNNIEKYKVFIPNASGNGRFGETISEPVISLPGESSTPTFLGIGSFDTLLEAKNVNKYIQTKFTRALLGILKITHHITPGSFKYVPLQDFTPQSDIDWSKSIAEIDQQLYKKYGLSEEEIEFIETHVKEMN